MKLVLTSRVYQSPEDLQDAIHVKDSGIPIGPVASCPKAELKKPEEENNRKLEHRHHVNKNDKKNVVVGSCHGVRKTKEGPGQAQYGVETLMHRAWVTHHHCPLALEQSVMGGPGINVNRNKIPKTDNVAAVYKAV